MDDQRERPSHDPGTRRGEEIAGQDEPGRQETGTTGTGRPTGKSTARDYTGINPEARNPIDPESPHLTEA
ncbi:MAG: hypothetical protein JOZ41_07980 [Chloroflexi bacterium]|nr:hypothetical protein [Chloroflexota bacterium]